jgi:hypothetical protein
MAARGGYLSGWSGVDQGIDFLSLWHGGQIAAPRGDQRTDGSALINSFLHAVADEKSREVASGKAVASADGVDRCDSDLEYLGITGRATGFEHEGSWAAGSSHQRGDP